MSTVKLAIAADPAHVRVVRLVAAALARLAGVADEAIDDIRLATGEACGRAVAIHQREGRDDPVVVEMTGRQGLEVVVADTIPMQESSGTGAAEMVRAAGVDVDLDSSLFDEGPGSLPEVVGIIEGLADTMSVKTGAAGTRVVMHWNAAR